VDIHGWDERYRSGIRASEDLDAAATPLLIETARNLPHGKALDLACRAGRNTLWLAENGWNVTAVDGSGAAIELLRRRASEQSLQLDAQVADLSRGEYRIEHSAWDLIAICYYLQRDLIEPAKLGVAPGGVLIAIVHITEPGEEPSFKRAAPGELESYFQGWQILHRYEGKPTDTAHRHAVAEIVAQRPRAWY
jgi:SAM-dependent methyltransferase